MNTSEATRQIYWNMSQIWLMYPLFLIVAAVALYGVYKHFARWRQGLPVARFDRPAERTKLVITQALLQVRTARENYAGFMHRFMFFGFIVLVLATTVVALDADLGMHIMKGRLYLYFQSLAVDVFGALTFLGVVMAAGRRWFTRPRALVYTSQATWLLVLMLFILATGFLVEGARIAATQDPWAAWSPFGNALARLLGPAFSVDALRGLHRFSWWLHLALSFAFLAWVPYTKLMHIITGPLNIYTASLAPIGANLKNIEFEGAESFGVNTLAGFTWKDLLDLDACTECGRCTAVCPANTTGKALSPRDLILGLRTMMNQSNEAAGSMDAATDTARTIIDALPETSQERLWQCTTCAACVEACPVLVEQMPKIVDLRRYSVMEMSEFPESMQEALTSLESRSHPFRGTQATRLDWADGLDVPLLKDMKDCDVLLWIGCSSALVERNQKIARATAQLLSKAGVKFGILGREEKCCGDPARRIGNEFLFESLAKENSEKLNAYGVKKIVTACPHCFNTLKHEYAQYGATFEVLHHSQFLSQLMEEGKLTPSGQLDKKVAFHDPCYLGRHNRVYEEPRNILKALSSQAPLELRRSGSNSFCCGGGGGLSFFEEPPSQRVNRVRAGDALESGVDVLAVGCPFCMSMMEDGINADKGDRDIRVLDISELLLQSTL